MRLTILLGLIVCLAIPGAAFAVPDSSVIPDKPTHPLSGPSAPSAAAPEVGAVLGARSGTVWGQYVRRGYGSYLSRFDVAGRAGSYGGRSGYGGQASFNRSTCGFSCVTGAIPASKFHHYRVELEIYVNGNRRVFKRCSQRSTCSFTASRTMASITTRARFCGDRKDDGQGTICTDYSVATRYR
jgi:hypothetical protein